MPEQTGAPRRELTDVEKVWFFFIKARNAVEPDVLTHAEWDDAMGAFGRIVGATEIPESRKMVPRA